MSSGPSPILGLPFRTVQDGVMMVMVVISWTDTKLYSLQSNSIDMISFLFSQQSWEVSLTIPFLWVRKLSLGKVKGFVYGRGAVLARWGPRFVSQKQEKKGLGQCLKHLLKSHCSLFYVPIAPCLDLLSVGPTRWVSSTPGPNGQILNE